MGAACELGFGQGISANIHAAASVTQWHGTDFNPSQAGFAQSLASATGSSARFYDQAFDEFANRDDLPEFDYIGLHGIWSWISDENRQVIVDSKVSLTAYERYCSAETEEERQLSLQQHVLSLKSHIKQLSETRYQNLPQLNSLDFVLLFVKLFIL
jgi:hypothetical protein